MRTNNEQTAAFPTDLDAEPNIPRGAARNLPYAPNRYFEIDDLTVPLEVRKLILSRARPDGIANAARLMLAAYEGRHPKRSPISVQPLPDGRFLVRDGNSTVANAVVSGWRDVPCRVVDDHAEQLKTDTY